VETKDVKAVIEHELGNLGPVAAVPRREMIRGLGKVVFVPSPSTADGVHR
jgi:hypothetical protein